MPNGKNNPGYNVDAARRYLAQWLTSRRLQLADNAGGTEEGAVAAQKQLRNMFSVPAYSSVSDMNVRHNRDYVSRLLAQAQSEPGFAGKNAARRADWHREVLNTANETMNMEGAYGAYVTDRVGQRLVVTRDNPKGHQSVLVHELAHSMEAAPQENRIAEILKGATIRGGYNDYLESPTEVHSRLMEVRHGLGLDPNRTYTIEEVREMMQRDGEKYRLLDRYDDRTILRLLNEVASVRNPAATRKGLNA